MGEEPPGGGAVRREIGDGRPSSCTQGWAASRWEIGGCVNVKVKRKAKSGN